MVKKSPYSDTLAKWPRCSTITEVRYGELIREMMSPALRGPQQIEIFSTRGKVLDCLDVSNLVSPNLEVSHRYILMCKHRSLTGIDSSDLMSHNNQSSGSGKRCRGDRIHSISTVSLYMLFIAMSLNTLNCQATFETDMNIEKTEYISGAGFYGQPSWSC